MRTLLASLAGVAAAGLALSACNPNLAANAAQVNGQGISSSQLTSTLGYIANDSSYTCLLSGATGGLATKGAGTSTYAAPFAAQILTTLVEERALAGALAARHLQVGTFARQVATQGLQSQLSPPQGSTCSSSGVAVLAGLPQSYRRFLVGLQAEQAVLLADGAGVQLTANGVRRYAAAHPGAASLDCVSAIETTSKGLASSLASRVAAGASFAALARRYSIDTTSAPSGGALGCVLPAQIASALGATVASLQPGQVSAPVAFGQDWVLFELTSRKTAPPTQVAQVLLQSVAAKDSALVSAALRKVRVQVDPTYGHWAKVSGIWEVVPPTGPPANLLANPAAVAPPPATSPLG